MLGPRLAPHPLWHVHPDCIRGAERPKGPDGLRGERLKARPSRSDSGPCSSPVRTLPTRPALRALRASLNTPVLGLEELPPGPASAAIACLAGAGGPRISLALRSLRSGDVVFYGPEEGIGEWRGPEAALDAALCFAES